MTNEGQALRVTTIGRKAIFTPSMVVRTTFSREQHCSIYVVTDDTAQFSITDVQITETKSSSPLHKTHTKGSRIYPLPTEGEELKHNKICWPCDRAQTSHKQGENISSESRSCRLSHECSDGLAWFASYLISRSFRSEGRLIQAQRIATHLDAFHHTHGKSFLHDQSHSPLVLYNRQNRTSSPPQSHG